VGAEIGDTAVTAAAGGTAVAAAAGGTAVATGAAGCGAAGAPHAPSRTLRMISRAVVAKSFLFILGFSSLS
jgi:hypothetical protein